MQNKKNSIKYLLIAFGLFALTMVCSYVFQELQYSLLVPNSITVSVPPVFPIGMFSALIFLKKQLKCTQETKYIFRFCIKLSMFVIGLAVFSSGILIISEIILAVL